MSDRCLPPPTSSALCVYVILVFALPCLSSTALQLFSAEEGTWPHLHCENPVRFAAPERPVSICSFPFYPCRMCGAPNMFLLYMIGRPLHPGQGCVFFLFFSPFCRWGFPFRFSLPVGQQAKRACTKKKKTSKKSQKSQPGTDLAHPPLSFLFFLGSREPLCALAWTAANSVGGVEKVDRQRTRSSVTFIPSPCKVPRMSPYIRCHVCVQQVLMWPGQVVMQQLLQLLVQLQADVVPQGRRGDKRTTKGCRETECQETAACKWPDGHALSPDERKKGGRTNTSIRVMCVCHSKSPRRAYSVPQTRQAQKRAADESSQGLYGPSRRGSTNTPSSSNNTRDCMYSYLTTKYLRSYGERMKSATSKTARRPKSTSQERRYGRARTVGPDSGASDDSLRFRRSALLFCSGACGT